MKFSSKKISFDDEETSVTENKGRRDEKPKEPVREKAVIRNTDSHEETQKPKEPQFKKVKLRFGFSDDK